MPENTRFIIQYKSIYSGKLGPWTDHTLELFRDAEMAKRMSLVLRSVNPNVRVIKREDTVVEDCSE